jgi:orotate phosphoribosyltransferase
MRLPRTPHDIIALRNKAFEIIKERSFSRGRFVLASGRESNYYLDMKPSMFHPEGVELLSRLVLKKLEGIKVHYIGGLEVGAVPLLSPIAMISESTGRGIPGFFVRKTVKDHGTKKRIEGVEDGDLKGMSVVILDDVTTTGESAMTAVKAVQDAGGKVELVLSIVDREEGATEYFEKHGIPFKSLFRGSELLQATEPSPAP